MMRHRLTAPGMAVTTRQAVTSPAPHTHCQGGHETGRPPWQAARQLPRRAGLPAVQPSSSAPGPRPRGVGARVPGKRGGRSFRGATRMLRGGPRRRSRGWIARLGPGRLFREELRPRPLPPEGLEPESRLVRPASHGPFVCVPSVPLSDDGGCPCRGASGATSGRGPVIALIKCFFFQRPRSCENGVHRFRLQKPAAPAQVSPHAPPRDGGSRGLGDSPRASAALAKPRLGFP